MNKSEAYLNGWFAHKNNVNINGNSNPYTQATQYYSCVQWLSGWCDRFSAVKHGLDLSLDEKEI